MKTLALATVLTLAFATPSFAQWRGYGEHGYGEREHGYHHGGGDWRRGEGEYRRRHGWGDMIPFPRPCWRNEYGEVTCPY